MGKFMQIINLGPKTWVAVANQVEHLLTGRLAVRFPAPLGYM